MLYICKCLNKKPLVFLKDLFNDDAILQIGSQCLAERSYDELFYLLPGPPYPNRFLAALALAIRALATIRDP